MFCWKGWRGVIVTCRGEEYVCTGDRIKFVADESVSLMPPSTRTAAKPVAQSAVPEPEAIPSGQSVPPQWLNRSKAAIVLWKINEGFRRRVIKADRVEIAMRNYVLQEADHFADIEGYANKQKAKKVEGCHCRHQKACDSNAQKEAFARRICWECNHEVYFRPDNSPAFCAWADNAQGSKR